MTTFTEARSAGDFLLSGSRAIDYGRLAAAQEVLPGTVLAERQIVAELAVTASADPGNTVDSGALTLASPAGSSAAIDGAYTIFASTPLPAAEPSMSRIRTASRSAPPRSASHSMAR